MKDKKTEEEIVSLFIKKNRQERVLWELNNSKEREYVIQKFSGPELFKEECLEPLKITLNVLLKKNLFSISNANDIYYIGESCIGNMSLTQAVATAETGERCIIYFGHGIGYYQGERELGNYAKYLLRRQMKTD